MFNSKIKVAEAELIVALTTEQSDQNDKQKASAVKHLKVLSFDLQQWLILHFYVRQYHFIKGHYGLTI